MTTLIVQAGGKGTRLEHCGWNKPKCLVPIDGKPILYHLLEAFSPVGNILKVFVIAQHKIDVLERYLEVYPPAQTIKISLPSGHGTVSGISNALLSLEEHEAFWVVWSDLVFHEKQIEPKSDIPIIFLSRTFPCRWSAQDGSNTLVQEKSDQSGVMGLFWFPNKTWLAGLPENGEFVQWLSANLSYFETRFCDDVIELGTLSTLLNHWDSKTSTRFFNRITYHGDRVTKQAVLPEYQKMIDMEVTWYKEVNTLGFRQIPKLYGEAPMTMARIDGSHPFQMQWGIKGRRLVLEKIFNLISELHQLGSKPSNPETLKSVYLEKTVARIQKVGRLLPRLNTLRSVQVNGVWVRNVLHQREQEVLSNAFAYVHCEVFTVIHGDPTFSNIIVDRQNNPWFIDPRGYFSEPGIFGDPNYDWAKLFYSIVGNYDYFNRRQFILSMNAKNIDIEIRESGWSHFRDMVNERLGAHLKSVHILHAFIWLSLSGWVDDDYDSILAAYFNGLYHLQRALEL
ncbi:NTP_transf_3 domain-containing protein [Gammaproteobacteria bacterium]